MVAPIRPALLGPNRPADTPPASAPAGRRRTPEARPAQRRPRDAGAAIGDRSPESLEWVDEGARDSKGARVSVHGVGEHARGQHGVRRPDAAGPGRLANRARRAGGAGRPERGGQVHPDAAAPRRPQARRRRGDPLGRPDRQAPAGSPGRARRIGLRRGGRRRRGRRRARARPGARGRPGPLADEARPRRAVRLALLGDEAPGPARQVVGRRAGRPAPGRADEPPRHRVDPLARRVSAPLRRHARLRHPRPDLPRQAGHPDRRGRPRPAVRLVVRLRDLPRAQGGRARRRGAPGGPLRQAAGRGGGLDSQGDPGPADPQRGAGPGAQGDARGAPGPPRADRQHADARPGGRAVGRPGHRGQGGRLRLRRPDRSSPTPRWRSCGGTRSA